MAFDFKKEYKEFYLPPRQPSILSIPQMQYLAVRGRGNPNEADGEYSAALNALYGVAYTLKMSYKSDYSIAGFFEYVVPPLEGLWWQEGTKGMDYARKDDLSWISLLRLPDFVRPCDFEWAVARATQKKQLDFSGVELFIHTEGLCVQCLHLGRYDDEPETLHAMDSYAKAQGYQPDITARRYHHEIYLSDPRKTEAAKLKTVIRHPIKPQE